jgi:heptosyltransferase-1
VLIVKASALGDVVHALPVLAWLKSADPAMEIDWLVEEGFAPLLDGHPLLRRVFPVATHRWRRQGRLAALREGLRVVAQLRSEKYNVVLDLQGNSKSGLFTMFSGASHRYGFDGQGVREWPNLLATNCRVSLSVEDYHVSDRSLAIARAAFPTGKESLPAGPLFVNAAAAHKVDKQLAEYGLTCRRFAVLHYGTTWKTKLWPLENWSTVVRHLVVDSDIVPVLTWGSDGERAVVEKITEAGRGAAVIWPRGTLPDLTALLARAAVVIGGDTGPVHIAAAVGIATVSIYRVTDGRRNGPRGEQHIRLQAPLNCSACLRKECERDLECGTSIHAASVIAAVERLLPHSAASVVKGR